MSTRWRLWTVLAVALIGLVAADRQAFVAQDAPRKDPVQTLSISTIPRLDPPPTLADFVAAFALAADAGVTGDFLSKQWSEIEPSTGNYQLEDTENYLSFVNGFYDYTLFVGIQVINTTARETPADLLDVPFDDPRMIAAFKALFDALRPSLTENIRYFSIGNEVDVYLNAHPDEWATYKTFFDAAAQYVRQSAPWLQVGVTVTYGSAQIDAEKVEHLTENADIVILTYYPFLEALMVDDPAAPLADFPRMLELGGGRPVILQEVGYPSAEMLGSSVDRQAQFVRVVFDAWEAAGDSIPFLNFFLLHDFTEQMCSDFELYYAFPNERFHAMLCSLGLRQPDGTPKPAWEVFVEEAGLWAAP